MYAATTDLLPVVDSSIAQGQFLNEATARLPVAVLGVAAAQRLGIDRVLAGPSSSPRRSSSPCSAAPSE